jgi:transposase
MQAYSPDLRQRIVESLCEGSTGKATAERFDVSLSTVKRYKRDWKSGGRLAPKPIAGRPRLIKESEQEEFLALVASKTNWTLDSLGDAWEESKGFKPTVSVLSRTCKRLKITRKKSPASPEKEMLPNEPPSEKR